MRLRLIILLGIIGILPFQVWAADSASAGAVPKDPYAAAPAHFSCPDDAVVTSVRCEGGICLTEAPGGVSGDHVLLKGKVESPGVTGLLVYVQQQRNKVVTTVNASKALKEGGQFEISVPLPQLGSYTISIQAMHVGGNPLVISARVSRVIAPHDMNAAAVVIKADEDHISINVDLERSCRELAKIGLPRDCDLIGSQTGATTINAVNKLNSGRQISRSTNAGTEGKFNLCMPLGDGQNTIDVQVCNPALPSCVALTTKTISFSKPEPTVQWIDTDPTRLRFSIDHWTPANKSAATCAGEIQFEWNRERVTDVESKKLDFLQRLCPVNGEYRIVSQPVSGVNELSILLPGETGREFHFTFGWGNPVWAKDVAASVMAMHMDHTVVDRVLPGIINRFLESDQFAPFIASLLEGGGSPSQAPPDEAITKKLAEIRSAIPACKSGGEKTTRMKVIGKPHIGSAHVNAVSLESQKLAMDITLDDIAVQLQYFRDANHDGAPDKAVFPLKIGFKTLRIKPRIAVSDTQILLTSDEDDCAYKSKTYCKGRPSIVQPKDFVGNIDGGGAFVMCDAVDQLVPAQTVEACKSVNNVDAKTGLISEQILEAINDTLYCDVSTQLTYARQNAQLKVNQDFAVAGRKFSWKSEVVLDAGGLKMGADGISLSMGSLMAGDGFYYASAGSGAGAPTGHSMGLMVREDLINQALAALVTLGQPGSGLLDWTLDEKTIAAMGFDFATECAVTAEKKEPSPVCVLRPRLEELLGSDLHTANYYNPDQPMRIMTRRSPESQLSPHVRFRQTEAGEMVVDLDIPDLEMTFSAILKDSTSEPVITARATILLSFTLDKIESYAADPSQLAVSIRLRHGESRVAIMPVMGSNRTMLPDHVLVGKLRSVISLALDLAKEPEYQIPPIKIPKSFLLPATQLSGSDESLLSRLGLAEIQFADGKLQWGMDSFSHALTFTVDPILLQRLLVNGAMQEFRWGE